MTRSQAEAMIDARNRLLTDERMDEAARIVDALANRPLTEWERAEAIRETARRMAGAGKAGR